MKDNTKITTDHDTIKQWAEKYGGKPQIIDDPQALADMPGVRIDFPGKIDDELLPETKVRNVSWDEFFKKFEELNLAFMYIDKFNPHNKNSVYKAYRFIKRDALEEQSEEETNKLLKEFMDEFIKYVAMT